MRDTIPLSGTHFFAFSLLLVLAIIGYETIAPWLIIFKVSDYSDGIAFVQIVMLILALYGFIVRGGKSSHLLYALLPYLLFRFAFLGRLVENIFYSEITLYFDTYFAFIVFFFYGLLPSVSLAKNAQYVKEQQFSNIMEFCAVAFSVGILLNYQSIFNTGAFRVGLASLNSISLTSAALTFLLYFAIFYKNSRRTKFLAISLMPLMIAVAALSKSRGPIVGLIAATALYFFIAKREHQKTVFLGVALVAIFGLITQYLFGIDLLTALFGRFQFSGTYNADLDMSGNTRQLVWALSWNQFLDAPIIGRYIVEYKSGGYPHNIILESLISMGVFGLILLIFYVASVVKHCIALIRGRYSSILINFVIILFFKELFEAMFSGNLIGNALLWILSCFIIASSIQIQTRN